jgi:hypothetical protein
MASSWDPEKDMPNLEGKVAVVTGGKYYKPYPTSRAFLHC